MVLKPIPLAERPVFRLKVYSADSLLGKRKSWGQKRKWTGNYIFNVSRIIVFYNYYY